MGGVRQRATAAGLGPGKEVDDILRTRKENSGFNEGQGAEWLQILKRGRKKEGGLS